MRIKSPLMVIVSLMAVFIATSAPAQQWNGSLGIGYAWLNTSGNEDSFRTQNWGQDGFMLEELDLRFDPEDGGTRFQMSAWGFGDAETSEGFDLGLSFGSGFQIDLKYSQANSFFALDGANLSNRHDEWDLTRWYGGLTWTGWENWTLALELRNVNRDGLVYRDHYGMNEFYPVGIQLDEEMNEINFRVENRSTPVRLVFEQSFARYERSNRPFAHGSEATNNPDDPDLQVAVGSDTVDTQDVPTSRLAASWNEGRWEGIATLLYSKADLEANGTIFETYDIGGGAIGRLSYIDELVGSTEMDSFAGALRLGFRMATNWTLRLDGNYRDASADANLLGRRLLHTVNPAGQEFDLEGGIDENGLYDFSDSDLRLTIDWQRNSFGAWVGASVAARDVEWRRTTDAETVDVNRDSNGIVAGISWSPSKKFNASAEYENDTFERYVFRTDPEKVDRLTLRLTSRLDHGWHLGFHLRQEQGTNPSDIAGLDRDSGAYGASLGWTSDTGAHSFGLSIDKIDLTSLTDIILPNSQAATSVYDLDMLNFLIYGQMSHKRCHLNAHVSYTEDDGETWPVDALNVGARFMIDGPAETQFGVFVQYWDYNEEQTDLNDYDATRYGLSIRWRFSR